MPESRPTPSAESQLQSQTPTDIPQNSPPFPIPKNNADQTPQLHAELSLKQQDALNRLFSGQGDQYICQTLKIDRKTLYNWKHRHPAFIAEMARRNQDIWNNLVGELREAVIDSVATLREHLRAPCERMTQLRAARTLLHLVNSPRLTPTAPTTITGVLNRLLAANSQTSAPAALAAATTADNKPTFTHAQREALLNQLLTENAAIESEADALFESRRRRPTTTTVPAQPADSTTNHLAVAPQVHAPTTTAPPPIDNPQSAIENPLPHPTPASPPATLSSTPTPMTRLCVPILVISTDQARRDAAVAAEAGADIVEFRIDHLADPAELPPLLTGLGVPAIVTCRPEREGGLSELPDADRLRLLAKAAENGAAYVDLELDRTLSQAEPYIEQVPRERRPGLIASAHDFTTRPDRLYNILADMNASVAEINKIVWTARTLRDNLEAFEILTTRQKPTIALCMGEPGIISRILAKKFGAFLTFASLNQSAQTAPGQVTIDDMKRLYRWDAQNANTKVYGVVGSPIMHSMSPALHNAAFEHVNHDGVYLPLLVNPGYESFKAFMESFLNFQPLHLSGLSITIPHKENALRCLKEKGAQIDPLAESIGAINTIVVERPTPSPGAAGGAVSRAATSALGEGGGEGSSIRLRGFSTDYAAILDSITEKLNITREQLKNYRVAVLGAGGTGRTAVAALAHYGATVVIYNRTIERAESLAAEFNGKTGKVVAAPMQKLCDSCCQIFINTTSVGMHPNEGVSPIDGLNVQFTPDHLVFDAIYNPMQTKLLQIAQAAGAKTIGGVEMFVRQAAGQFEAWTHKTAPATLMRQVVERRLQITPP